MIGLNKVLDIIRDTVRGYMNHIAGWLNTMSHGRLHPNTITYIGFGMHLPIAMLIGLQQFIWAAGLLVVFGLFDALDGALARTQKRDSDGGMLLDASTDRMKEVLLYVGIAYALVQSGTPIGAVWAVAACGASICVSYVKAKGEAAVASSHISASAVNTLFKDGLLRFEVRMFFLVVGLLSNQLLIALIAISILSTYTAFDRLVKISRTLEPK
jgi:phosphatidylglycerophosphate synthase